MTTTIQKGYSGYLLFIKPAFSILLLAAMVLLQYGFDAEKRERPLIPPTILPVQAIKLGDLGLHSAAAALMWIYTIQKVPIKTPELIRIVNELDPRFSYPYAFAAFFLPPFKATDQAIEIAKKGLEKADHDWRIAYYLATTYHVFLKDRHNAALYFDVAVNTPGAPEKIKLIAARYGASTNALEQSKQIWMSIYETSNDEVVIERAKNYIIHLEIIEILEKAVNIYKQKYGYYPKDINDLVIKRVIKKIPESPLGVKFGLKTNGEITVE